MGNGKLYETSEGLYIFELEFNGLTIKKIFKDANALLNEVDTTPKNDGFFVEFKIANKAEV